MGDLGTFARDDANREGRHRAGRRHAADNASRARGIRLRELLARGRADAPRGRKSGCVAPSRCDTASWAGGNAEPVADARLGTRAHAGGTPANDPGPGASADARADGRSDRHVRADAHADRGADRYPGAQ